MTLRARGVLAAILAISLRADLGAQAKDTAKASPIKKRTAYEDLQMFSQVLNQIRVNHLDSIDTHDLFLAAVTGMIHAADPHSYVIPAIRLDTVKEKALMDGKLHPIPVAFRFVGGTPVVASVAPGSAASRADILVGDALIAIEGKPVLAESAPELEVATAGPKGSKVRLTFERRLLDGTLASMDRDVKRESASDATGVPAAFMLDSTTGYVRITTFVPANVADDLRKAIGKLESSGMRQLVLDLRDNGGGRIDQAAFAAGEFLPKGAIVYTTEGRKAEVTDTGRVSRSFWKSERRYPMVLLVNAGTASASELLAGALQDHDRAIVVGQPTFGKALVMRGFPMTDGSVIVLVMGQLRTPCGRIVQRQYRDITRRDYYRLAAADRDTAGRPTCKTDAGRVVYGGGGIYPDIRLERPAGPPVWGSRLIAEDMLLPWAGGWITANASSLTTAENFAKSLPLSKEAVADFRRLAAARRIDIPLDADYELQRLLLETIAFVKFGEDGVYRVTARFDKEIAEAITALGRLDLLSPKR